MIARIRLQSIALTALLLAALAAPLAAGERQVSQDAADMPPAPRSFLGALLSKFAINANQRAIDADSTNPQRDPTSVPDELRELLTTREKTKGQTAAPAAPKIPQISVRARVVTRHAQPIAYLGVGDKQTMAVREGREYLLPGSTELSISVLSITADQVEIEIRPLKKRFILQ